MNRKLQFVALVVAFLMLGTVVSAHHSRAQYGDDQLTTQGVVVEYRWGNPHVYIVWEVSDSNGGKKRWLGEMASLTSMIADGMTKNSLKVGDEIEVVAFPSERAGSAESLIKLITKADGTVVVDNSRAPNLRAP
jgi:hypothetical protein